MRKNTIWIRISVSLLFSGSGFLVPASAQNADNAPATDHFDYAELAKAPAKARARKNPQEGNTEAALVGRKLFMQHCAECHGASAEGGKKAPSLLVDQVQQATPGALFWLLTNGVVRRGMPVWSKLPEPQRWAIVTYIRTLSPPASRDAGAK